MIMQGQSSSARCCETGRPILIDPSTGRSICSCQYVPGIGLVGSPGNGIRVPSVGESLLASAYAAQGIIPVARDQTVLVRLIWSHNNKTKLQTLPNITFCPSLNFTYKCKSFFSISVFMTQFKFNKIPIYYSNWLNSSMIL